MGIIFSITKKVCLVLEPKKNTQPPSSSSFALPLPVPSDGHGDPRAPHPVMAVSEPQSEVVLSPHPALSIPPTTDNVTPDGEAPLLELAPRPFANQAAL